MLALVIWVLFGIPLSLIDYKFHRIPNKLNLALSVSLIVLPTSASFTQKFHYASLALLLLAIPSLIFKGAIGIGDIKYCGCIGIFLAEYNSSYLFLALEFALVLAGIEVLLRQILRTKSTHIAFGPHLFLGATLSYLLALLS